MSEEFRVIQTGGSQRLAHIEQDYETGEITIRYLLRLESYKSPAAMIEQIRQALDKPVIMWPEAEDKE